MSKVYIIITVNYCILSGLEQSSKLRALFNVNRRPQANLSLRLAEFDLITTFAVFKFLWLLSLFPEGADVVACGESKVGFWV